MIDLYRIMRDRTNQVKSRAPGSSPSRSQATTHVANVAICSKPSVQGRIVLGHLNQILLNLVRDLPEHAHVPRGNSVERGRVYVRELRQYFVDQAPTLFLKTDVIFSPILRIPDPLHQSALFEVVECRHCGRRGYPYSLA